MAKTNAHKSAILEKVYAQINIDFPISTPRIAPEKVHTYIEINGKRVPVAINSSDNLQVFADAQQRIVVRVQGMDTTYYEPNPPKKVMVFTESEDHTRTLINEVDTPSANFKERCENYADKHGVRVVVVFPDGSWSEHASLSEKDRAYLRKYQPTMSKCTRCGSITCAGVGSTGIRCKGGVK